MIWLGDKNRFILFFEITISPTIYMWFLHIKLLCWKTLKQSYVQFKKEFSSLSLFHSKDEINNHNGCKTPMIVFPYHRICVKKYCKIIYKLGDNRPHSSSNAIKIIAYAVMRVNGRYSNLLCEKDKNIKQNT